MNWFIILLYYILFADFDNNYVGTIDDSCLHESNPGDYNPEIHDVDASGDTFLGNRCIENVVDCFLNRDF